MSLHEHSEKKALEVIFRGFFSPTLSGLEVLQYQLHFRFALPFIDIEAEGGVDAGRGAVGMVEVDGIQARIAFFER